MYMSHAIAIYGNHAWAYLKLQPPAIEMGTPAIEMGNTCQAPPTYSSAEMGSSEEPDDRCSNKGSYMKYVLVTI